VKQLLHAENMIGFLGFTCMKPYRMYTDSMVCLHIATNPAKLGNVRHLQIRYHLVRCYVTLGNVEMKFCITEKMVADLFTKLVAGAQDERLTARFYCLISGFEAFVLTNDFKHDNSTMGSLFRMCLFNFQILFEGSDGILAIRRNIGDKYDLCI
jgi:hypothetical protein